MTAPLAYQCSVCGFSVWRPIVAFDSSTLGLYDDHRFPGRCLLVLRRHVEQLETLDGPALTTFMQEATRSGEAIKGATGAERMNYAVLGNAEPHLHVHIVPRMHHGDPIPGRSPWQHPEERGPLRAGNAETISQRIRSILER